MNKILSVITVSVFLISCQKELSFPDAGSNSGGSNGTLLVKTVTKTSTDSSEVNFFYDGNKRLIRQYTTGTYGGQDLTNDIILVRNSSGIITQMIYKSPALQILGIDSLIDKVYYDNGSKQYTGFVQTLSLSGFEVIDSTVYSYSGNNIIESNEYQTSFGITGMIFKSDYSYTGANLTSIKSYAPDSSGNISLVETSKISYDNKPAALTLPPGEAFIMGNIFVVSSNNPLSYLVQDGNAATILSSNNSYTYNSSNRPQTDKVLDNLGVTRTISFYYQ